jgi:hypothetical protein
MLQETFCTLGFLCVRHTLYVSAPDVNDEPEKKARPGCAVSVRIIEDS